MDLSLEPGDRARLEDKFPGRIPVFVIRDRRIDPSVPYLPKTKFLVPKDLRVGQFIFIIRRQLKLPSEKALFLFIGGTLPTTTSLMSEMYSLYKSPDGALRVTYMSENTFGGPEPCRMSFYTTPENEKMWESHYARAKRKYGNVPEEIRVFDVRDNDVYHGNNLCDSEPVDGGGVYKLDPAFRLAVTRFQAQHKDYRVIFELGTGYNAEQDVYPATLVAGIQKLKVEDPSKYECCIQ